MGGEGQYDLPLRFLRGDRMNATDVFRYTILIISAAAMALGVLIIAGVLVPRNFPEQFRVIMGIVVFLYGLYRFVIAYYRSSRRSSE